MLTKPKLVVLDGPSSAGKTSLAKALQEELLPNVWLNFSIDSVIYALPNSILERCNTMNDWTDVDDDLLFAGTFSCVNGLMKSGYSVIFDVVLSTRKRAEQTLKEFANHDIFFIAVKCEWEEIKRRTSARGDRTLKESEYSFKTSPIHLNYDCIIDTTRQTPVEAAKECLKSMSNFI